MTSRLHPLHPSNILRRRISIADFTLATPHSAATSHLPCAGWYRTAGRHSCDPGARGRFVSKHFDPVGPCPARAAWTWPVLLCHQPAAQDHGSPSLFVVGRPDFRAGCPGPGLRHSGGPRPVINEHTRHRQPTRTLRHCRVSTDSGIPQPYQSSSPSSRPSCLRRILSDGR